MRASWLCLCLCLFAACSDLFVVGRTGRDGGRPVVTPPAAGDDRGSSSTAGSDAPGGGMDASVQVAVTDAEPPPAAMDAAMDSPVEPPPTSSEPDQVSLEPGSHAAFCGGRGLPLRSQRPQGATSDCGRSLARKLFSYALCSCGELGILGSPFLVDGFDSSRGAYQAGQDGAAVGVNDTFTQLATDAAISGSLFVVGENSSEIEGGPFSVAGDFKTNAKLEAGAAGTRVARDLWVAGDILAPITVGRDAFQGEGYTGIDKLTVGGKAYPASDFRLRPPCACDGPPLVDVSMLTAQARIANDNAAAGFNASTLNTNALLSATNELPCGRLYVDSIRNGTVSTVTILANGRTVLFVDGDVVTAAVTTLILAPALGGELDIFINGDIRIELGSTFVLGDPVRPAATRVYLRGAVEIGGGLSFSGHLYAPNANVDLTDPLDQTWQTYGSIFARNINLLGSHKLHYDRAILQASADCSATAPQRCDGCDQCPGELACVAGTCKACARDADCCLPAVCSAGKCQLLQTASP